MEKLVPVMAVKKALDMLEALHFGVSENHNGMPLSEIARMMDMKPNSARNLLKTMIVCGYVEQGEGSKYLPGPKCRQLGVFNRAMVNGVSAKTNAVLAKLTNAVGEASVFTVLIGGNRVILGTVQSNHEIKISQATIAADNIFRTSTGRILAAFANPSELEHIIDRHGLPGEQWNGLDSLDSLRKALAEIRNKKSCSVQNDELFSLAMPVFTSKGSFCGAIGCYSPVYRCPSEKQQAMSTHMKACADEIAEVFK